MSYKLILSPSGEEIFLSNVRKAKRLFEEIARMLPNESIEIDFTNVLGATPSWLFGFIGNLVTNFPKRFEFGAVKLVGVSDDIRDEIKFIVKLAKKQTNGH